MSEWRQGQLSKLAHGVRSVSYRPEHLRLHFADDTAVLLRSTNIQNGILSFDDIQLIPKALLANDQRVSADDIVVCMSNGSNALVGKSAPCKGTRFDILTIGAFCSVFHPKPEACPSFVAHFFQSDSFRKNVDVALSGSAINNLRNSTIEQFKCAIPPFIEQSHIAAVLDTVDAAIAKTEAVIAKLKQVRAGLLHDLLTCGLNEHGQLRDPIAHLEQFQDSPWGQIPKEWEVRTCQSICRDIVVGIVVKPVQYYVEEGVPVLRSANVREEGIQMTDLVFISDKSNAHLSKSALRVGDIVTVRTGYPGTSCVVPAVLDGANCVDLIISRPGTEIVPEFLALWINSPFGRDQVLRTQGGLAQQHFNVGELKTLLVAKPERDEQMRIVERLVSLDLLTRGEVETAAKLALLKSGLMTDLLTGRVRVPEGIGVE